MKILLIGEYNSSHYTLKEGLEAFQIALDFVATNYPNTEEGKKALEVIETIKSKI